MKQYIKLAWRNLWRNKRRTLLTLASVITAVVMALGTRSMQKGSYGNMISNAVRFSTGYLQIHSQGYWDDQTINNAFTDDIHIDKLVNGQANVTLAVPRLEYFALASSGAHSKGVGVLGIDPDKENLMNKLAERVQQGAYLTGQGSDALLGDGLAKYLGLSVGDTLVLIGQGYHGSTAGGKFPVSGIFHFPIDQLNNEVCFLSLPDAQGLFGAPGMLTSVSLMLKNPAKLSSTAVDLRKQLGAEFEVMEWPDMNKSLVQEIKGDNAGGLIMLAILYLVVAFGVFGTVMMMTLERRKEFAVLVAVGMRRSKLMMVLFLETLFIGLLGVIAGIISIYPLLWYWHEHPIRLSGQAAESLLKMGLEPIMPCSLEPSIFISQGIIVALITFVSVIYPLYLIRQLPIATTLKQ